MADNPWDFAKDESDKWSFAKDADSVTHALGVVGERALHALPDAAGFVGDLGVDAVNVVKNKYRKLTGSDLPDERLYLPGTGPAAKAVNESFRKGEEAHGEVPSARNKAEEYLGAASEGAAAGLLGGPEGGGLAVAGGAVAGPVGQKVYEATGNETLAYLAAMAAGSVPFGVHAGHTMRNAARIERGASHPDYANMVDNVIPDLEGGGTIEHPKTNPKSGAFGPMQVTPETLRQPGYGIKPWDGTVQDSVRVGREKYAAMLGKYHGDHEKALAAYNWGEGNVDRAFRKYGEDWLQHAPEETQNYVGKGMLKAYGGGSLPENGSVRPMEPNEIADILNDPEAAGLPSDKPIGDAATAQPEFSNDLYIDARDRIPANEGQDFSRMSNEELGYSGGNTPDNVVSMDAVKKALDNGKVHDLLSDKLDSAYAHEDAALRGEIHLTPDEATQNRQIADQLHASLPEDHSFREMTSDLVNTWRSTEQLVHELHGKMPPGAEGVPNAADKYLQNLEHKTAANDARGLTDAEIPEAIMYDAEAGTAHAMWKNGAISDNTYHRIMDNVVKRLKGASPSEYRDEILNAQYKKETGDYYRLSEEERTQPTITSKEDLKTKRHTEIVRHDLGDIYAERSSTYSNPEKIDPVGKVVGKGNRSSTSNDVETPERQPAADAFGGRSGRARQQIKDRTEPPRRSEEGHELNKGSDEPTIQKMVEALKEAKPVRNQQKIAISKARAERFQKVAQIYATAEGPAAYRMALAAMKGDMPKADFEGIGHHFDANEIQFLFDKVGKSKRLTPGEKLTGHSGLQKLLSTPAGQVPTASELKVLSQVFPKELIDGIQKDNKYAHVVAQALNTPRTIMASFDLSAPLRQGIFLIGRKEFYKAWGPMFKQFFSEKAFKASQDEIASRPSFRLMQKAGLALTDEGNVLTKREEAFMSNWAEKIPGIGHGVRASSRAYMGFLNKLRADTFDTLIKQAQNEGLDLEHDYHALHSIARFINNATGRGDLGRWNTAAPVLNGIFFSPRLIASRINTMNPVWYATLHPFARRQALKSLLSFSAVALTVLGLAKMGGADVEADPRSADFGKIKIGNTRYDILGGYQQFIRTGSQIVMGSTKGEDGDIKPLNSGKFGAKTRLDVAQNFVYNKTSPVASFVLDWMRGKDAVGNKFQLDKELLNRVTPMVAQDAHDLYKDGGMGEVPGVAPGIFGVGVQTYTPREKKSAGRPSKSEWDFSSASDNPWSFAGESKP